MPACSLPVLACSTSLCEAPLTSQRLRCSERTHASCVCSSEVTLILLCPLSFVLFRLCLFLLICVPLKCKMRFASPGPSLHGCGADIGRKRTVFFYLLLPSPAVLLCPLLSPSSTLFTFSLFLYPRMLLKGWSLWRQDYPQGKDSRVNI